MRKDQWSWDIPVPQPSRRWLCAKHPGVLKLAPAFLKESLLSNCACPRRSKLLLLKAEASFSTPGFFLEGTK